MPMMDCKYTIKTTYALVKYKYKGIHIYTAFCLTPKLAAPRVVERGGKTFTVTSKGRFSDAAKHFQRSETAKRWLASQGHDPSIFDWSVLPGTTEWPPEPWGR